MNICEVCGKMEDEDAALGMLMETLHICESCRQDRLSAAAANPGVRRSAVRSGKSRYPPEIE